MIRITSFSFFNKIKKCRASDQARWIRPYPMATMATMTTTSPPTDSERPIVMLLVMAAATTAWLSGPEQTQNEPPSSPDMAAESQSRDPAPSPPPPLKKCGSWCSGESILGTKCTMDPEIMPCEGVYCQTDCRLWNEFILKKRPKVTCDQYKAGLAYPRGAVPCAESCLPPELRKDRYPSPTGLGLMCKPGTCTPTASMADLECPCNWFGTNCQDQFIPVRQIRKVKVGPSGLDSSGSAEKVFLQVDSDKMDEILRDYQPGSVVRVHHYGPDGVPREAVAAVVVQKTSTATGNDDGDSLTAGTKDVALEILLGPTDTCLHPETTQVHDRLRKLPSGAVENLYVTPAIGGFFNKNYTTLVSFLESKTQTQTIDNVIVVSSGSALGAALGAVEAALDQNKRVQLFYGVRTKDDIPYKERLEALAKSELVDLTIVLSTDNEKKSFDDQQHESLDEAINRGEQMKLLPPSAELQPFYKSTKKLYTQHVAGSSLFGDNTGSNNMQGTGGLSSSVFVICGRSEVLLETLDIVHACVGQSKSSESFLKERIFTNV